MPSRRELLLGLAWGPILARCAFAQTAAAGTSSSAPTRGFACALGEQADALRLPQPRRHGESIALALAGTPRTTDDDLAALTGRRDSTWIELSASELVGFDEGPLARRIRAAGSVCLMEGSVLQWLLALWPARRRSELRSALIECAESGGRLIGRGSTAFLVASGGVVRGPTADEPGESRLRASNPRNCGEPRLAQGLDLGGDFIVDTDARSNGSLLRLLSTLVDHHLDRGLQLGAHSAVSCDLESRAWTSLGTEPLLFIDLQGSRRGTRSIGDARISTLSAGDGWRRAERRLFSVGEACDFELESSEQSVPDALLSPALRAPPRVRQVLRDDRVRIELRRGTESAAFVGPGEHPARGFRMALDVTLARGNFGELGP